jgi:hypothetical protein
MAFVLAVALMENPTEFNPVEEKYKSFLARNVGISSFRLAMEILHPWAPYS